MPKDADPSNHGGPAGERHPLARGLDEIEAGKVKKKRTERTELIHDPNHNQAGNDAGSRDKMQGSQTGSEVDLVPERDLLPRRK
jgi:hypothetical protein